MKVTYTQAQLEHLCRELERKAISAYKKWNQRFHVTTTPSHYDTLAEEINGIPENQSAKGKIKPEWLRDLFSKYQKQSISTIQSEFLDCCCRYLTGETASTYFSNLTESVSRCYGTYKVYWKGTTLAGKAANIKQEYTLKLSQSECLFIPNENDREKKVTYIGNAPTQMSGNVYADLKHPNQVEKLHIIFHIGIGGRDNLEYLSALFLAVDRQPHPCSGPMLLIREDITNPNPAFIEEFFERYGEKSLIKGITTDRIAKMLENLIHKGHKNKRLYDVMGNWYIYTKHRRGGEIDKAKIKLVSEDNVLFESYENIYHTGRVEIISTHNLVIHLQNETRYANIIANIGAGQNLAKTQRIIALYSATGRKIPVCGVAVLQKSQEDFEDMSVGVIKVNDIEMLRLEQDGILDIIDVHQNIYLPDDDIG